MFVIGDRIVYPMHGAGIIEEIEEIKMLGEVKDYYVMRIEYKDMKVKIPVKKADELNLRSLSTVEAIKDAFVEASVKEFENYPNWNTRYRVNIEKIKDGKVGNLTEVISMLHMLDVEKGLSTGEKQLLNNSKEILASEIKMIEDIGFKEAIKLINEFIENLD
ncbi:MAG: CarD family transcriptional regulator [Clostridiales bacterium]|nr:CarD family transcriptional regulator [Clostridiales bacterium]